MKQRHLLFASLLAAFSVFGGVRSHAQSVVLSEDFERQTFPPDGWTVIDADGDGHSWQSVGKVSATLNGSYIAVSYSVDPQTGKTFGGMQDNWLITPAINVTNASYNLSFKCCAEDEDSMEPYQVLVSETGTNPADFTKVLVSENLDNGYDGVELQGRTRSLAEFAGKRIYIAFRHTGMDSYALGIDDVSVTNAKGPAKCTALTATAGPDGAGFAVIKWTNPSADGTGAALSTLSVDILRDGVQVASLTDGVKPGQQSEYTDSDVPSGTHTYTVVARTAEGVSQGVSKTVYVGLDVPAAVSDLTVGRSAQHYVISWTAPAKGANGGFLMPDGLTYDVFRVTAAGRETVARGLKQTTCTDAQTPGQTVRYAVVPATAAGSGEETLSGGVVAYSQDVTDFDITPSATVAYANERLPFDLSTKCGVTELMLYPSDLKSAHGTISDIVLRNSFSSKQFTKPITVWMGETDEADLSKGWYATSQMTKVFSGNVDLLGGANDIPLHLTTPYAYTGKNLVVMLSMEAATGSGTYFDRFYVQMRTASADRTRYYTAYSDIDVDALAASDGDLTSSIPALRVVMAAEGVARVSGTVRSASDGKALAGATVTIADAALTATTDADGSYCFEAVPAGTHDITVEAPLHVTATFSMDVPQHGTLARDFSLAERAMVTIRGRVALNDNTATEGIDVSLSGYTTEHTVTAADGSFAIKAFKDGDYKLTASYPLYDSYTIEFNDIDTDKDVETVTLRRSLIAPYGTEAAVKADGSAVDITWHDPATRTNAVRWTRWSTSDINDGLGGDTNSPADFCVAHAFDAKDIQDSCMVGLSFTRLRAYVKGSSAHLEAKVWRGTRDDHVELTSEPVTVPDDFEGWITIDFPDPVEIRSGESYMVGLHCTGADESIIGHGPSYSKVSKKNCLRFTDAEGAYTYDYFYAWNLSAECGIPGSYGSYGKPAASFKAPTYNVYRSEKGDADNRTLVKENVAADALSCTDSEWTSLKPATYQYYVEAVYGQPAADNASPLALSNEVVRSVDTDAGVEAVLSPERTAGVQTAVEVKVRIANYGEKPLTGIPVSVTVDPDHVLTATYSGTLAKGETADVVVGNATLTSGTRYTIHAATAVVGDEVTADDAAEVVINNFDDVELTGFRWDAYGDAGLMRIHTNVPEKAVYEKEVTPDDNLLQAGEYVGDKFYGFTGTWQAAPADFVSMDVNTWTPTFSAATSTYVIDMTYDYTTSTMYGLGLVNGVLGLCTIDVATGFCDGVGTIDKSFYTIACDAAGHLYGIASDGVLYTIDKSTGAATAVGPTGVTDVMYLQSMTFDRKSGRLFWAQTGQEVSGSLYEVNPQTGAAQLLGTVMYAGYPSEVVALAAPSGQDPTGVRGVTSDALTAARAYVDAQGRIHAVADLAAGQAARVTLCTTAGAVVADVTTTAADTVVGGSQPEGVYVVSIVTSDGRKAQIKVAKR